MIAPARPDLGGTMRLMAAIATMVALQPGVTGLASILMAGCSLWICTQSSQTLLSRSWVLACVILAAAALQAGLSPALAMAAVVTAVAVGLSGLAREGRWLAPWIAALALVQLPASARAMLVASDAGPAWTGLVVAPLIVLVALVVGGCIRLRGAVASGATVVAVGFAGYRSEWNPPLQATLAALPVAAVLIVPVHRAKAWVGASAGLLAIGIVASLWTMLPALGKPGPLAVWVPQGNTPIAHYFDHYEAVLRASGFQSVRAIGSAEEVKPGDWVLLPNATHPAFKLQLEGIRALAHRGAIRIVVAGEHTDADGVASVLRSSGSPVRLHADTTIPPGNADLLGWSSGVGVVADRALAFNRGASIDAHSWRAVPLVWVQGGHRELDRSDDGRLGDMVLRRGERAGLYGALAVGAEPDGPVWVVLGDSTPALNEHLAANPASFAKLLALASGWPALLGVCAWAALFGAAVAGEASRYRHFILGGAVLVVACTVLTPNLIASGFRDASQSKVIIVDREPYGDRAVSRAVVALSEALLESNVSLEVGRVSNDPLVRRVSIGHPAGWAQRLDCTRAGNVTASSVRLLDVVTCPEAREGSVLGIGVDAVAFQRGEHLVVLDQHFLANAAPRANVEWIRSKIEALGR